jgi:hypothetical protein
MGMDIVFYNNEEQIYFRGINFIRDNIPDLIKLLFKFSDKSYKCLSDKFEIIANNIKSEHIDILEKELESKQNEYKSNKLLIFMKQNIENIETKLKEKDYKSYKEILDELEIILENEKNEYYNYYEDELFYFNHKKNILSGIKEIYNKLIEYKDNPNIYYELSF